MTLREAGYRIGWRTGFQLGTALARLLWAVPALRPRLAAWALRPNEHEDH